jgi:hypothetical protein
MCVRHLLFLLLFDFDVPFFYYQGRVEKSTDNDHGINCTIYGCATEISDTVIEINEIPPGRTIVEYKTFLQSLLPDASNRSEYSKMKYPTIEVLIKGFSSFVS